MCAFNEHFQQTAETPHIIGALLLKFNQLAKALEFARAWMVRQAEMNHEHSGNAAESEAGGNHRH